MRSRCTRSASRSSRSSAAQLEGRGRLRCRDSVRRPRRAARAAARRRAPRLHAERRPRRAGSRGDRARHPRRLREAARRLHRREQRADRGGSRARARERDVLPRARLPARRADAGRRRRRRDRRASRSSTGATSATTCSSRPRGGASTRPGPGPSYVVGDLGTHWLDLAEHVTGQRGDRRCRPSSGRSPAARSRTTRRSAPAASTATCRARSCSRPAQRARKNQLLFECEGTKAGLTWDQELPTEIQFRPADGPRRIVVKDPATNAEAAQPLSRYPAGHGEGYGQAFRNLFDRGLRGDRGTAARAVSHLRRRPPRRRDRRSRRRERPRRRLGDRQSG